HGSPVFTSALRKFWSDGEIVLVGSRSSTGNHRWDALRDGQRAILHPQSRSWEDHFLWVFLNKMQPKHIGNDVWDVAMERRDKKIVDQYSAN
ncbi:hypothetical protein GW17_00002550, partial [Ensete ventricosum]